MLVMPALRLRDLFELIDSEAEDPVLYIDADARELAVAPGAVVSHLHVVHSREDVIGALLLSDEPVRVTSGALDAEDRAALRALFLEDSAEEVRTAYARCFGD
ncbi:hypothetical protein [Streptomyces sp. NPDC046685]|uniref:hypothetical protein n=1 Tax=Streptomyces sp. NPDC046685 TaxID=3157202 RepID=UPI0033F9772A